MRIVYIDDQITPDNALVRLLETEGFQIACACTASEGLAIVRSTSCDAEVLDLHLPDGDGLDVLKRIRASRTIPVIVVTGYYLDLGHAVAAMKVGAFDFKHKPLYSDELADTLRAAIKPTSSLQADRTSPSTSNKLRPRSVQELFEAVTDHLAKQIYRPGSPGLDGPDDPECRLVLLPLLVRALTDAALTIPIFLACAAGLTGALNPQAGSDRYISDLAASLERAMFAAQPSDPRVALALARLENVGKQRSPRSEEAIARDLHVDRTHLGRLIASQTGLDFRTWRRAATIREAAHQLSRSTKSISEIASALGYEHSQLDREFRGILALSPQKFRRLLPSATAQRP